ncbi:MAG: hypothetical protein KC619_16050 [Myxococcales bacterium]|nr:hypothetical protein [Myxococcales bacterium]
MHEVLNALAFASALTAIFAFRFRARPWVLGLYFAGFGAIEVVAHRFVLPEGTFPPETAWVLFVIAALFLIAGRIQRRFAPDDGEG